MKMLAITHILRNYFLKMAIADMEKNHFRTEHDIGANDITMQMHNYYRHTAGLPFLTKKDLSHWCEDHKAYDMCHNK